MKAWMAAAGLIILAGAGSAKAADLGEGPPPPPYDQRYDGQRYGETYRAPPPPVAEEEDVYEERYGGDRYAEGRPGCVPRREIGRDLARDGWGEFSRPHVAGSMVMVRARRPDGRLFALRIDRCTGQVLHARAIEDIPPPYARGYAYRSPRDYGYGYGHGYGPRRWAY